jgi:hypothetical protein
MRLRRREEFEAGFAGGVEFGFDAKGEGDVGAGYVAAAEAKGDGYVETIERAEDGFLEQFRVSAGSCTVEHFAKDDADAAVELAGLAQLPNHAVDLMRLCPSVFDEEEFAFGLGFPWSAEEGDDDAEAAAIEGSADNTARGYGFDYAETFLGADAIGLACERGQEAGHVDAVFAVKVGRDHGAVEGGKADFIEQVELDGCEVAIAEERLGMSSDELQIEAGKKVIGAVATADRGNERGVGIHECAVDVRKAMSGDSGEEERAAFQRVWTEARLEAEFAEVV